MKIKNLPQWVISGIMIFPVLIIIGLIFNAITLGSFNILFWLITPSMVFEELFETCCYALSNNQFANLLFAFLFWFIIGATTSWAALKFKRK